MNFLGMGPMELVLIMVLALIVFGPGKLPEIAGQVGRMVRDFKNATTDMSSEFNKAFTLETDPKDKPASDAAALPSLPSGDDRAVTAPEGSVDRGGTSHPTAGPPQRRQDLQPPY